MFNTRSLRLLAWAAFSAIGGALFSGTVLAKTPVSADAIHLVWMGGDDCPPCVIWRREQLPKLEQSAEFKAIRFSYVHKTVRSPVPALAALPEEVKPYKQKLDFASSGRSGSPQAAVIVNGEVFDYFHGRRSAEDIERMIVAIRTGQRYPFKRCVKMSTEWGKCEQRG